MFKIVPNPVFDAEVEVPVPGTEPATLVLTFKHKNREEVVEYFERISKLDRIDAGTLMELIEGWKNVDSEFNEANLQKLMDNYHGATKAIFASYSIELAEGRRKN